MARMTGSARSSRPSQRRVVVVANASACDGRRASLLAAGVDIALVSKLLGHSSISLTSDTYSHLLEGVRRDAAERASALVPRNRADVADDLCDL